MSTIPTSSTPPVASLLPPDIKQLPWIGLSVEQRVHKTDSTTTQFITTNTNNKALGNVAIALEWLGFVGRFDAWTGKPQWAVCPWESPDPQWLDLEDSDIRRFKTVIEREFDTVNYSPPLNAIYTGVETLCEQDLRNSQQDAFQQACWDGYDHYQTLAGLLGQDSELGLEYGKLLVRGVVVRAFRPGATFPYAPVLFSEVQGVGKTDTLKAVSNARHALLDEHIFVGFDSEKKLREKGRSKSVLELGEMEGLSARGQASLKSLITMEDSHLRDSFAHFQSTEKVSFIIVASTNNPDVLTDSQHRRHPVLRIPKGHRININELKELMPQLWAQAVAEMRRGDFNDPEVTSGYSVRLPEDLWQAAEEDSAAHQQHGALYEFLNDILNESEPARSAGRVTGKSLWEAVQDACGSDGQPVIHKDDVRCGVAEGQQQAPGLGPRHHLGEDGEPASCGHAARGGQAWRFTLLFSLR